MIEAPLALCQSDHLPLSEPAQAVREILLELVSDLLVDAGTAQGATPDPARALSPAN